MTQALVNGRWRWQVASTGGGGDATNLTNSATGTALTVQSSTGSNTSLPAVTTSAWGVMTDEDKTKLDGITASANNYAISTDLLDEDNMSTNSATKVPSQQSVKAYADTKASLTGGTFTGSVTFEDAINENVYNCTGTALDPDNGTVQYKTLGANTTLTESLTAGQSMLLMVADGSSYTVTWPTMTWVGGSAPTLATSGYSCIELWKIASTFYGCHVGDVA